MAGVLAQAFLDAPDRPSFLIFQPGMDLLPLLAEAQALLPPEKYWDVTFSTYFTALPVGMNCAWRCCLRDSDALVTARRIPNALVIDLVERKIISGSLPANDSLALAARTGERPSRADNAPTPQPQAEEISIKATSAKEIARPNPRRITLKPDYTGAFRPIAPTAARRKKSSTGLVLIGVSLLIIAVVAISYMFSPPEEKQEAAPNEEPSTQTNHVEVVAVLPVQAEAQEQTSKLKPETALPSEASVPKKDNDTKAVEPAIAPVYEYKVGLSYQIGSAPEVTFWDTSGNEIQGARKLPPGPEGTSYKPPGSSMSAPNLARHTAAKGLSEISKDVAFIKINSTNEHVILFVSEANLRCKLVPQQDSFILEFPPGSGGDLLLKCINSENVRITARLTRGTDIFLASAISEGRAVHLSILEADKSRWKERVMSAENALKTAQAKLAQLSSARSAIDAAGEVWTAAYSNQEQSIYAHEPEKEQLQRTAMDGFESYISMIRAAVVKAGQFLGTGTKANYSQIEIKARENWRAAPDSGVPKQLASIYEMANKLHGIEDEVRGTLKQNEDELNERVNKADIYIKTNKDKATPDKIQIFLDNQSIAAAFRTGGNY